MLPEEMDAHGRRHDRWPLAGKAAIKAHRADLPVGLSLAIVDDVVVGDDATSGTASGPRSTSSGWSWPATTTSSACRTTSASPYDANGAVPPPEGAAINQMGTAVEPASLGGAVALRPRGDRRARPGHRARHVSTDDDTMRAGFIEPSLAGLLDAMDEGVPVLGYCHWTLMDNFEWIFGYGHQLGLHEVDREHVRAHTEAERRCLRRDRRGWRRPQRSPCASVIRQDDRVTPPERPGRRTLTRADLPEELTPEALRHLGFRTLRQLAQPGNGVLDAEEQRQFDVALEELKKETAALVDTSLQRSRRGGPGNLDPEMRRSYARTQQRLAEQARRAREQLSRGG